MALVSKATKTIPILPLVSKAAETIPILALVSPILALVSKAAKTISILPLVSKTVKTISILKSRGYLSESFEFSSRGYPSESFEFSSRSIGEMLILSDAVRRFQLNHGLKDTGFLDRKTVAAITGLRCGAPDIVDGMNLTRIHSGGASCFTLFSGGPRWENTHLTYSFKGNVPDGAKPAFEKAFAEWSRVCPQFTFKEIPATGDIKIGFYRRKHGKGDCSPFNGPGGAVAHGFRPCDGRLHVDKSQLWSYRNLPDAPYFVDLESAVLHEIGHILGLNHSSDKNAVMYANFERNKVKNKLTKDDIRGINFLYGKF